MECGAAHITSFLHSTLVQTSMQPPGCIDLQSRHRPTAAVCPLTMNTESMSNDGHGGCRIGFTVGTDRSRPFCFCSSDAKVSLGCHMDQRAWIGVFQHPQRTI